uniref:Pre-mRNA-splicing factor 38B n=1 Tax=Cercocebus atys TaxID=9531 RepID=A0A2K5P0I1_CERAT
MADLTLKGAHSIGCTRPQYLFKYWTEECFGLMAELVVHKVMELMCVGGMLQVQSEKGIIVEFIKNEDFKYVHVFGALYMRLTGTAIDCYKYLEPLYNDYRKVKSEFMDELVLSERVCGIILPWLQKQEAEQLEPPVSALEEDMDSVESSEEEEEEDEKSERALGQPRRSPTLRYRRSRSLSPRRRNRSPKRRSLFPRQERHRSKSPRRHHNRRHRSRSKSPGSHHSHRYRSHSKCPKKSKKSHKKSWRGNE